MTNILRSRAVAAVGSFLKSGTFGIRCIGNKVPDAKGSDARWRAENGLPANRNSFGPLTNLPDYTFLDGRPTPLGSRQKKRILKQREVADRIVQLSQELNFAKERFPKLQRESIEAKDKLLNLKLKPKGHKLL